MHKPSSNICTLIMWRFKLDLLCQKNISFLNLNSLLHRVINKSVSLHSRCFFPTNRGFHQQSKSGTISRKFSVFKLFYFIAWEHDQVTNKKLLNQATYILPNQIYFQRKNIYSQWFPNALIYHQIDIIYISHYFINSGTYLHSSFLFFKVELIAKELGFLYFRTSICHKTCHFSFGFQLIFPCHKISCCHHFEI
jgi:hypothetical protein